MSESSPFGPGPIKPPRKPSPFGEAEPKEPPGDAAVRIEQAARKIRGLRGQLGSEGLPVSAMRELLDEVSAALDAAARALREIASR